MRKVSHAIPPSVRVQPQRLIKTAGRPRKAAILSGVLSLLFFVVLYGAVPDRLPLLIQRLVGLASALLVMSFVTLSLSELGRRSKYLGISGAHYGNLVTVLGWVVFALVLAWWFTGLAPIQPY